MIEQTDTKLRSNFWISLIILVFIMGGAWIIVNRVPQNMLSSGLEALPVQGHPAPEIRLTSTDGELLSLSSFKGQPVIINFWATWCGPCRTEMPDFQEIHRELGDEVKVFSVNVTSQDGGDVEGFMKEFGITFPVLLDSEGQAFKDYEIRGLPTTIFINREGIINQVFTGPVNKAYIESRISEL